MTNPVENALIKPMKTASPSIDSQRINAILKRHGVVEAFVFGSFAHGSKERVAYGPTSVLNPKGEVAAQVPVLETGMIVVAIP
jgi:hypothetical protein